MFELLHLMYDQNVPVSAQQHGGSGRGQYGTSPYGLFPPLCQLLGQCHWYDTLRDSPFFENRRIGSTLSFLASHLMGIA